MAEENKKSEAPNLPKELERITMEKIKGRIIIFDAKNSEFAKKLNIEKPGDYVEKK